MIFLVNVPKGAFALLVGWRFLPGAGTARSDATLDLRGTALAAVAMFLLVFPLVEGHDLGWPTWLAGMLVTSVPALAIFASYLRRREASGRTPLVETSIFGRRAYSSGVIFSIVFCGSMGGSS
jgi:hypothetical protein